MDSAQQLRPQDVEILIVEDSPTQRERLKYITERVGYRTRVMQNGREALLSLQESPVDLVLSDIVMPEMDGYSLCRSIKNTPSLSRIPVILLTTLSDPKDIVKGLDCGADNFIRKPYEDNYLLTHIQHVLVNQTLRRMRNSNVGIEISLGGQHHFINAERQQILDLLISTFEQAVSVNEELKAREQQISELNGILQRDAQKLEIANRELATKNAELENASQAKLRFFAQMSHELRTPLNAVIGLSDLMITEASGPLNDEQKNYLNDILAGGKHLLSLINDTLDLAKLEAHKMELHPEITKIPDMLQQCIPMVREQATARHIKLQMDIASTINTAFLDARKISQIVINLLSNAVKFTPEGGEVKLTAEITPRHGKDFLNISVHDTGIGIASEDIPKLFRSFEQLNSSSKQQTQGTGLGLALVKQLAELHGGYVTVNSIINKGSCFTVFIPLRHENHIHPFVPRTGS